MSSSNAAEPSLDTSLPWFLRSSRRLFATLFLVIAVPLSTTVYLEITQISHKLKKQANYQNNLATQLVTQAIEEHYLGIVSYVESYATRPALIEAVQKMNTEAAISQLRKAVREHRFLDRGFIINPKGVLLFSYPRDPSLLAMDFSSRDWFQGVRKSQKTFVLGFDDTAANAGQDVVTVVVPMKDINGRVIAYLVNQESNESFMLWLKKINSSFGGTIALIDRNGNLVATNELAPIESINLNSNPFVQKARRTRRGQIQSTDPLHKKESLITYVMIDSLEWLVISSQPLPVVLAPLYALKPTLFGLGLACFSAIFILGLIWLSAIHRYSDALIRDRRLKEQSLLELEQAELFAFAASHDLQEPLAKIVSFGDLLKTQAANQLNDKCNYYISRMQASAGRMSQLIDSLLRFSRVTTKVEAFEPVDLKKVVKEVLSDLDLKIVESKSTIEVGKLPVVTADSLQMYEVFQNLISNAIKFRKKDTPHRISISSTPSKNGYVEISVWDNGVGFEPKYADKLFKPFERLHNRNEYDGSGMGLAICQKIVLRHGGRILAQSKVGEGSVFILQLPSENMK